MLREITNFVRILPPNNMRRILLLICLFVILVTPAVAQLYQYLDTQNGLSSRRVLSIRKDKKGYMWFLTHEGIGRKLIIRQNINGDKFEVKPILKADEIIEARKVVRQVYLDEKIEKYIVDIVFATRYPEKYDLKELKDMIGFGGSPRASINLALAARSYAFIKRRGYVIPEDVRAVAHDVLRHRIGLTYEAEASNMTSDEIVSKILNKVEVP